MRKVSAAVAVALGHSRDVMIETSSPSNTRKWGTSEDDPCWAKPRA